MKSFATSIACVFLLGAAAAQEIKFCGELMVPYQDLTYTCIDNYLLCPIIAGYTYKRCGDSCFSDLQYNCTEARILQELPQTDKPYQVAVLRKDFPFLDGQIVNAVDYNLVIGEPPHVDCPSPPIPDCSDFKNITVFAGIQTGAFASYASKRASLDTELPGGQQALLAQSGLLSYSLPHSASIPGGEYSGPGEFRAYKDGEFLHTGGKGWRACLVDDRGKFEIYQQIDGYQPRGMCIDIKLVTKDPGVPGPYAYEY